MRRRIPLTVALAAMGFLSALPASAADHLHKTYSVEIAAPPAKVWGVIENFSDLTWVPPVKSSTATEGNAVGSVRTLDLGGPKLIEQLVSYSPAQRSYTYKITDAPANKATLPVSHYQSTIVVAPGGAGSKVTWSGTFERADTGTNPQSGMDDATAEKSVAGVYKAGLDGLKQKVEGG